MIKKAGYVSHNIGDEVEIDPEMDSIHKNTIVCVNKSFWCGFVALN
jgi:hypothetical protein